MVDYLKSEVNFFNVIEHFAQQKLLLRRMPSTKKWRVWLSEMISQS
jgi:hypothetical protein